MFAFDILPAKPGDSEAVVVLMRYGRRWDIWQVPRKFVDCVDRIVPDEVHAVDIRITTESQEKVLRAALEKGQLTVPLIQEAIATGPDERGWIRIRGQRARDMKYEIKPAVSAIAAAALRQREQAALFD